MPVHVAVGSDFHRRVFVAALLFSAGGFMLLLGYLVFQGLREGTHALPAFVALILFVVGWVFLEESVRVRAATAVSERIVVWSMWAVLFVSLLGPLAGLGLQGGFYFLVYGVFPFIPLYYGPAVIAHAFLFLLAARGQSGREAHYMLWAGGAILIILAVAGLASWIASWISPANYIYGPTLGLAGYTGFGYALIAVGWWRLLRKVESQPG